MLFQSLAQQQQQQQEKEDRDRDRERSGSSLSSVSVSASGSGSDSNPSTLSFALPQQPNGTGVPIATQGTGLKLSGTGISTQATGFKLGGTGLKLGGTGIATQAYQTAQAPQEPHGMGMRIGGLAGMKLGGMGAPTQPSGFKLSGGFLSGQPLFQPQPQPPQVGMGNMPVFDYYSSSESSSDSGSDRDDNYSGSDSQSESESKSEYSEENSGESSEDGSTSTSDNNEEGVANNDAINQSETTERRKRTTNNKRKDKNNRRRRKGEENNERSSRNTAEGTAPAAVPKLEVKDSPYTLLNSGRTARGLTFANWGSGNPEGNGWEEESVAQSRIDSLSWEHTAGTTYTRLGAPAVVDHSGTVDSLSVPQTLTVKDWFMILDAQIRSSGVNVSLSDLYLRKFEDEDITMHTLPFLTEKDLIDMGVSKMGHRKLIMSSIAKLPKSGQSVFVSSASASSLTAPKPLLEMSDAPDGATGIAAAGRNAYAGGWGGAPPGYTCLSTNQQAPQMSFATQGMSSTSSSSSSSSSGASAALQNPLVKHGMMQRHQKATIGGAPTIPIVPENSTIMINGSEGKMQNILCIDDVKVGKKIGEGSFGEVFQAVWHGNVVAAKKTKRCDINNDLLSEYSMYLRIRHPNCVSFYGVFYDKGSTYMVTEFMPNGSLRDLLRTYAASTPSPTSSSSSSSSSSLLPPSTISTTSNTKVSEKLVEEGRCCCCSCCGCSRRTLPLKMALGFARDVAAGMLYLSSLGIVHRDLASRNILLKEDLDDDQRRRFVAKVSDFGLSRVVTPQEGYYRSESGLMPIQWSAPEALRHKRFSTKTDVWSYGVLLWEIFAGGAEPYDGLTGPELRSHVEGGGRLAKPAACPDSVYAFMQRCWAADSTDRPSFKEIYDFVDSQHNAAQDVTEDEFDEILRILYPEQHGGNESSHGGGGGGGGGGKGTGNGTHGGARGDFESGGEDKTRMSTATTTETGGGGRGMPVLTLNFTSTERTLQELYDQSMGRNDPISSLNFTIALCQYGDLPGAYNIVSELLLNATPDPGEKIWAAVFFVRGTVNTRLGDFYAAGKDFSQAVSFMRAMSLGSVVIPHVSTAPEGRFKAFFPPAVSASDVGCAAGNAFFYHAITGSIPAEERIRIFAMTESTFTRALEEKNAQRGNIFFNLGQIYYCHSVYASDAFAQEALLLQALDCYASALPLVPRELQADIHIMKAKALARLRRYAEASAALEASLKIDPLQSIPDLKSPRELTAQPEVPAGIVCGSKSEHDFQKINMFSISTFCCNYCGRIQLFQRSIYRCARCGYTVHAQCLPALKFVYCYGEKEDTNAYPLYNAIKQSGAACKGVHVKKPPVFASTASSSSSSTDSDGARASSGRNCDSDDETERTEKAVECGRRRSVSSGARGAGNDPMEGIYEEKARSSKMYPNVAKERYVVTHVHALRPGIPYFENCHTCSKAFRIGESSVRCVKCRKIFHSACVSSAGPYIMLHPSEFPSLNSSAIQMCGWNNVLYWPKVHTQ